MEVVCVKEEEVRAKVMEVVGEPSIEDLTHDNPDIATVLWRRGRHVVIYDGDLDKYFMIVAKDEAQADEVVRRALAIAKLFNNALFPTEAFASLYAVEAEDVRIADEAGGEVGVRVVYAYLPPHQHPH